MIADITYGILHYNPLNNEMANNYFVESIESLILNKNNSISTEIYLIDQGNPSEVKDIVYTQSQRFNVNFISLKQNIGISDGINLLVNISDSNFISLVTSDVVFCKNLDNVLLEELENDKTIWQICPLSDKSDILYQQGEIENKCPTKCIAQELTIQFWPKQTFQMVGDFYSIFRAGFENLDYALRIFCKGGYAAVSNKIKIKHYHNMCVKSGARNYTYPEMHGNYDSNILKKIWDNKWPNFNWEFLYQPSVLTDQNKKILNENYSI